MFGMIRFFRRAAGEPQKLGILAGTFNPPTRAHLAMARAALDVVDEVVFVLPRVFPHKPYEGASFEERVRMLELALADESRCSIASSDQGLFIDIARECREAYGPRTQLYFVCGKDAAERVVNWDYGRPGAIAEQLREFQLLVFPREGAYEPPAELRDRIHVLPLVGCQDVSATRVREAIRRKGPWEELVPAAIVALVREIYGA